ncbi:hypothetical protein GCK72_021971 [Caenorhabditis remanei]|uniref:Uncharacterized protein n=1 Tax=Caenorhabditis remanei TaxID=31234 RepID=A0A6A5GLM8_CAERE|nr:hypothetical protein GCK72_021971 [Caenorhabditis remanei]KAF1755402.1 hypothetical protein GCK72_021971 [Caenorhabditis remanei]
MSETSEVPLPMDSFDPPPPPPPSSPNVPSVDKVPYPQTIPLLEDAFKNLTLVGTIKLYKDYSGNLHIASG